MKIVKATPKELALHQAVTDRSDTALLKLYDLYGESIIRKLKSWYSKLAAKNDDSIPAAVNEAFLGYYNNPATFNPQISSLERFLEMAAERDLKNDIEREKDQEGKENLPDGVELQANFWNSLKKDQTATDQRIIHKETIAAVDQELGLHFKTDQDLTLAKMVLSRERETGPYAEVLEIGELTTEEQKAEVKKHKDRIKKILERHGVEAKLKKLLQ
ncbi:hypothetical protein [Daejeonella sp. JGW-45]|uniref:hypothetical protein n=1 Tax=Daejeonella sp. JGW-45 TaxID=3034148 RepID=UPI0023EB500B|nr:hypothetical protein [Daejeonella sp. JGW-45]